MSHTSVLDTICEGKKLGEDKKLKQRAYFESVGVEDATLSLVEFVEFVYLFARVDIK